MTYAMRDRFRDRQRAEEYDAKHTRTFGQRFRLRTELRLLRRMFRRVGGGAPLHILDIPCGTGRHSADLVAAGHRLLSADISREMLTVARARPDLDEGAAFRPLVAELERLPLADGCVDAALSVRFLRHLPEELRWKAIAELARVGRRGAVFDLLLKRGLVSLVKRLRKPRGPASQRPTRGEVEERLAGLGLELVAMLCPRPLFTQQHFFWVRRR